MIKNDRAAGNQSISTPDHVLLVFPNGDWILAFIVGFDGVVTGNITQYLFSSGAFAAAGSLNVVFYADGVSGTTLRGRIAVYADTLANANAPALLSTTQFSAGRHLVVVQRSGGAQSPVATLYTCPTLAAAPIDDSAVITEATTTNAAILKELNGSGFMFGSRVDNTTDRKSDHSFSRMLRANLAITKFEIAQLAAGKEIFDLGYTPVVYVRASDVADIADRGPNALPFTLAGSPTTSAEPTFAYRAGVSEPPAVADAVTVSNAEPLLVVPSTGNDATVTFTGALSGTQATSVEVRMIAPDGALGSWVALQSANIDATAYSGTRAVPDGGPYRFQARAKSGSTVLAESQYSTAKILIGDAWINCGSSSSDYLFTDKSGTGFTVAPDTAVMSGTTPTWSPMSSTGAATRMADELATVAGKPIAWLNYGVAGTTLRTWLDPNSTQRKNLARAVAAVKGKIFGAYITVGANDAYNGWITSSAAHEADMQKLVEDLRTETGNPDLKVVWVGSPPRPALNPVQADRLRQAESRIGNYPGVVQVQALQFATASDNVHLAASLDGYAACGTMAMHQAGRAFYLGEDPKMVRGPALAAMTYTGTKVRCVVTTRDGTSFNPAAPGGFTVQNKQLDGSYVTLSGITAQRINANLIEIECGVALAEPIVKYLSGPAPSMTSAVYSNGALPLPMTVETEMVATQAAAAPDTTAPVMSGAISITNITTSGAALSFQAATDDVGAAGYEYSINGGASYVNSGLSRSFAVSALAASTTYQVRVRAYDDAGNRSVPLSASFTTLANEPPVEIVIDASKIPASRKVVFPGGTRVVPFGTKPSTVVPGAPYYRDGKWWSDKVPDDERYYVADFRIDIAEAGFAAAKAEVFVSGVKVLEQPVVQASLIPVKLGGFDELRGALNFCTFRVTLANGEQIDRTLWFNKVDLQWVLEKDPEDKRYYVADVSRDLIDSNTTVAAVSAIPVGVAELVKPQMQGRLAVIKLGGMDTSADPLNYCKLRFDCANGERFFRTIHFKRVDN